MWIYLLVVFIVCSLSYWATSFSISWSHSAIKIKDSCKFLSTFTHLSTVWLYFFIHVFSIWFLFYSTNDLRGSCKAIFFVLRGLNIFWFRSLSIESLLKFLLILNLINNFISWYLNFFQNIRSIILSLNLNCFINHLTEFFISLI